MGFSKLATEFVYSRRGRNLEDMFGEARERGLPYNTLQNIRTILIIKNDRNQNM